MSSHPHRSVREIAAPAGLVGGPFGSNLVSSDYLDQGVPVIRGSNMGHGRYVGGNFVFVSQEKFSSDLARNTASAGDIVFTQRGTLGQIGLVHPSDSRIYVISQSQMRLRVDPAKANSNFVYYAASTSEFLRLIQDRAIATGVPHINLAILGDLHIPLPSIHTQSAIAEVLGALDDKIAGNTSLVETADDLAQTVYQRLIKQHPSTSALTEIADFVNGRAFTKDASGTGRVVIRITELNSGPGNSTVYSDIIVDDHFIARPGDVLFAWSGSLTVHRWFRPEAIINQHIFKVIPKGSWPAWAIHAALNDRLGYFQGIAADKATTMGHIQRRHLDEAVTLPTLEAVSSADPAIGAVWHRALSAETESEHLANLRDMLLPKLMSGELRVKDAEKQVEEVV